MKQIQFIVAAFSLLVIFAGSPLWATEASSVDKSPKVAASKQKVPSCARTADCKGKKENQNCGTGFAGGKCHVFQGKYNNELSCASYAAFSNTWIDPCSN